MAYIWVEGWATGNVTIDTQHKQLFKAINDLLDACSGGRGRAHISATMKFLIEYTAKHFGDEEKLQQQYHYPDFLNHKKLHDGFKSVVSELAKRLQVEGPTISLVAEVNSNTGGWLVNHIHNEDKRVAAYIRSQ